MFFPYLKILSIFAVKGYHVRPWKPVSQSSDSSAAEISWNVLLFMNIQYIDIQHVLEATNW